MGVEEGQIIQVKVGVLTNQRGVDVLAKKEKGLKARICSTRREC